MFSCIYMKKLLERGKLNEVRVLAAWNNHRDKWSQAAS